MVLTVWGSDDVNSRGTWRQQDRRRPSRKVGISTFNRQVPARKDYRPLDPLPILDYAKYPSPSASPESNESKSSQRVQSCPRQYVIDSSNPLSAPTEIPVCYSAIVKHTPVQYKGFFDTRGHLRLTRAV